MYDKAKKPTPSKPSKPTTDGGYSGYNPKPTEPEETTNITIINPTKESKEETAPVESHPNKTSDKPVRKPIKTGDVMETLELLLGAILICGAGLYLNDKRRK